MKKLKEHQDGMTEVLVVKVRMDASTCRKLVWIDDCWGDGWKKCEWHKVFRRRMKRRCLIRLMRLTAG